jgi:hypothetical protein
VTETCISCGARPARPGPGQRRCNRCAHQREDPEKKRLRNKESYRRQRAKIGVEECRRRAREAYRAKHPQAKRENGREERDLQSWRRWRWQRRLLAIAALGGRCEACGIEDPEVLQFDHRIPVGSKARRGLREKAASHGTVREVLAMAQPADQFSLLCANCHVKKTRANGDYLATPHQHAIADAAERQLSLFDDDTTRNASFWFLPATSARVAGDLGPRSVGES